MSFIRPNNSSWNCTPAPLHHPTLDFIVITRNVRDKLLKLVRHCIMTRTTVACVCCLICGRTMTQSLQIFKKKTFLYAELSKKPDYKIYATKTTTNSFPHRNYLETKQFLNQTFTLSFDFLSLPTPFVHLRKSISMLINAAYQLIFPFLFFSKITSFYRK